MDCQAARCQSSTDSRKRIKPQEEINRDKEIRWIHRPKQQEQKEDQE
jgi:hypothetical protein